MGYNQKELQILGNILAHQNKQRLSDVFSEYEQHLQHVFSKAPRYTSQINVLDHIFGYLSQDLKNTEKEIPWRPYSPQRSYSSSQILGYTLRSTIFITTNIFRTLS